MHKEVINLPERPINRRIFVTLYYIDELKGSMDIVL